MLYEYMILLTGSFLAYRGAPVWIVVVAAMLLSLPRVIRDQQAGSLSLTTAVSAANALLFASASFGIGRVVASLLNSV
jgi:hypothetical protein